MITPGTVRSMLHPTLSSLIDRLAVSYIEPWTYNARYGFPLTAAGCYVPLDDIITVRPFAGHLLAHVFLHELVHWTGHPDRLNRKTFELAKRYGYYASKNQIGTENLHTEEATAQWGMYLLACHFNIEKQVAEKALEYYLIGYPEADLVKAKADAVLAVNYILNAAYGQEDALQST